LARSPVHAGSWWTGDLANHGFNDEIARPRRILVVPDMPKTRSGKLMRRILAALSNNMATGDITTLANPDVVESVRVLVQGKDAVVLTDVPEDLKTFGSVD